LIKVTASAGDTLGTPPALFLNIGMSNMMAEPKAKPISNALLLMNSTYFLSG
jgi:hypothetical protein